MGRRLPRAEASKLPGSFAPFVTRLQRGAAEERGAVKKQHTLGWGGWIYLEPNHLPLSGPVPKKKALDLGCKLDVEP